MLNQGNILKPAIGNIVVVDDIEDTTLKQCEYYTDCNLAGTSLKCSYRKDRSDYCFKPTLEYQKKMMGHRCPGCCGSDD